MALFDFHTHVFPQAVVSGREDYLRRDSTFRSLYERPKAALATAKELIAAMDRSNVGRSVACGFGWSTPELCRAGNDAVIDAQDKYSNRLMGFGTIAPRSSLAEALAEIERLAAAGIRGLGELRPDTQGFFDMAPEDLATLATAVREHHMMLLFHASEPVGHLYPGKGDATPAQMLRLIDAFSAIPIVLAHAGGGLPFYALMPEVKQALLNVYVDTAALPFLYQPEVLRVLIATFGADRILFGSDYPLMAPERLLAYLDQAGLTPEEREAITSGNATRLLAQTATRPWKTVPSPTT